MKTGTFDIYPTLKCLASFNDTWLQPRKFDFLSVELFTLCQPSLLTFNLVSFAKEEAIPKKERRSR